MDDPQCRRRVVDTRIAGVARPAGHPTWCSIGRRTDGTMLPPGSYISYVTATDGTLTDQPGRQRRGDAFSIAPRPTPARGQQVTVTVDLGRALSTRRSPVRHPARLRDVGA